nr:hypothetical protein [Xylanibacter rodentium]
MLRQHFYELGILLIGVICSHLVAGVTEDEEGNQYECREKPGHDHKALFMGHIVTDFADSGGKSPLRSVPHLII